MKFTKEEIESLNSILKRIEDYSGELLKEYAEVAGSGYTQYSFDEVVDGFIQYYHYYCGGTDHLHIPLEYLYDPDWKEKLKQRIEDTKKRAKELKRLKKEEEKEKREKARRKLYEDLKEEFEE